MTSDLTPSAAIMWRETETAKVFTYQGLTTCTELDKSWTIMSSTYNHLRQGRDKGIDELKVLSEQKWSCKSA